MSIFDDIPEPFPLNVSVKKRPVEFELHRDSADELFDLIMPIIWGVLSIGFVYFLTTPLDPAQNVLIKLAGLGGIVLLAGYFGRDIWQAMARNRIKTSVRITEDTVETITTGGPNSGQWSAGIDTFIGVAKENRGTHDIDGEKVPVVAVILQHEDDGRSIPLVITTENDLGKNRAKNIASQLNLPLVPYVHSQVLSTDMPKGTIVANIWQNRKLKLVYLFVLAAAAALLVVSYYIFTTWGVRPADGGVLKPLYQRLIFAGALSLLGVGSVLALRYYMSTYVVAMQRHGEKITIRTAEQFVGNGYAFRVDEVERIVGHQGKYRSATQTRIPNQSVLRAHTPFVMVTIAGSKRRFLIDMQAEYVDEAEFKRLYPKYKRK